jgi:hypothetical protein
MAEVVNSNARNNKKSFLMFLGIFYVLFMSIGSISTKASGMDVLNSISDDNGMNVVDTISVEKKNILAPKLQKVTVNIKNNMVILQLKLK